ncbi:hypothetical protein [Nocardia caishijiensis]|uniref:hypothetical protein n=1 Tax=Nocardia caishijiensis TaxID=184756 RepID=UPI0012ED2703|nr:hypothetical protein [Nocardia caishijiensis]
MPFPSEGAASEVGGGGARDACSGAGEGAVAGTFPAAVGSGEFPSQTEPDAAADATGDEGRLGVEPDRFPVIAVDVAGLVLDVLDSEFLAGALPGFDEGFLEDLVDEFDRDAFDDFFGDVARDDPTDTSG